jgi:methylthioribose-1-phosphate isomerase
MSEELQAITWTGGAVRLIDQTALPGALTYLSIRSVDELVSAIRRLAVRGAPALGAAGAYGVALALLEGGPLDDALVRIRTARPTAVNLSWGMDRVLPLVPLGVSAVLAEAGALVREDVAGNRLMGAHGASWIASRISRRPLRVLTHCNAGALATCGWGTALGVVRTLFARDLLSRVYVNETRPLLQGSRLTAYELAHYGIPYVVQADVAAASTILQGLVDVAIIGADRIAANGDTANKIGSLGVALACADAGIPFVVAAPWSTVDLTAKSGAEISIEDRSADEVVTFGGVRVAPAGAHAFNPAFDVTPSRLITALVTETGVFEVSDGHTPG